MITVGGRDRRAVRHLAPDGAPDAALLPRRPHAIVVGAGIAGLAAAAGLAERGVRVTVAEREPYLGGRVGGWTQPAAGLPMSRGFHAFFRQYYNLRALLRRADPGLRRLVPLADYPLVDADGHRDSFRGLPRTPPWNAIAFALRSPTFRLRDLLALNAAAAAPLAAVSVPGIYERLDGTDAETFLQDINFPAAARHLAFEVFSRSFFAPPGEMSAAELASMFHIYFLGSSEGLVFDVPDAGFDTALWEPLRGYLTALGVTFLTGTEITQIQAGGPGRFRVRDTGGTAAIDADGVVLAADVAGLRAIVANSPDLADPAWRRPGVRAAHRAAVPDPAAVAGSPGPGGPPGVPGHRGSRSAGQRQRAGAVRPAGAGLGPAGTVARWSNCTPMRLRTMLHWASGCGNGCTPCTRRPARPGSWPRPSCGGRTARCSGWATSPGGRR